MPTRRVSAVLFTAGAKRRIFLHLDTRANLNPNSPGMNRIVKASQGKSPGGTDRPELADGKVFDEMKAEFEPWMLDSEPNL